MGKDSPSAPTAPSATELANSQGKANIEAVLANAILNRSNVITPWGTAKWSQITPTASTTTTSGTSGTSGTAGTPATGDLSAYMTDGQIDASKIPQWYLRNARQLGYDFTRKHRLDTPQLQNLQYYIDQGLLPTLSGYTPGTAGTPGTSGTSSATSTNNGMTIAGYPINQWQMESSGTEETNQATKLLQQNLLARSQGLGSTEEDAKTAFYNKAYNLLKPQLEEQQRVTAQDLANRGIPIGSEDYNRVMGNLQRSQGEQLSNLANQATLSGLSAQQSESGSLYNMLTGSLPQSSGSQVQVSATPIADMMMQQYQNQYNQYANEVSSANQQMGTLGNIAGMGLNYLTGGLGGSAGSVFGGFTNANPMTNSQWTSFLAGM